MSSNNSRGGLSIPTVVLVIFVTLKVLKVAPVASWSWFWVLSPIWISFALFVAALIVFAIVAFAIEESSVARSRRGYIMRVTPGKRPTYYRGLPNNEKALSGYNYGGGPRR